MSEKYFVYRNSTLEHVFKDGDYIFSSYGGIEKCNESDRNIIVLYFIPYFHSEKYIISFIKEFIEKVQYVANMYKDKNVQVFSLYNYFYKSLNIGNNRIDRKLKVADDALKKIPNVDVVHIADFFVNTDNGSFIDEKYYYLYNTIISPKIASKFYHWFKETQRRSLVPRKKCLVLDLDNTIWGGILGEDGISGIRISGDYPGNAFHDFQLLIKDVAESGIILCTCSKNNIENVRECFKKRDDMVLSFNDFVLHSINWDDKATRIAGIASKLNIGLDSIVFIDDNPRERELVKGALPEVCVPDFPEEPYELTGYFSKIFTDYFRSNGITDEDRNKKLQYKQMLKSEEFKRRFSDEDDFIRSLKIKLSTVKMDDTNITRFSQLINKSNQFNLTTKRYSENDLRRFEKKGDLIYGLKVRDRFGDLGISGIAIVQIDDKNAEIDSFLMSCRALGRKIENEFLKAIMNMLYKKGVRLVRAEYLPTKKNMLVKDFYTRFGFTKDSELDGNCNYIYRMTKQFKMSNKYQMEDIV